MVLELESCLSGKDNIIGSKGKALQNYLSSVLLNAGFD